MDEKKLPLAAHLKELRDSLISSVKALVLFMIVAWVFRNELLYYLKKPLLDVLPEGVVINVFDIMEKFWVDLKVAFMGAIFLAAPWIFYQLWKFVAPGLYEHERKFGLIFVVGSTFFFSGGAAFCYFLVMPFAFDFLVNYSMDTAGVSFLDHLYVIPAATNDLTLNLSAHITFTFNIILAFGLAFETPLFMCVAVATGLVQAEWFAKQRRYSVIIIAIVSAILTPQDVYTMLLLMVPLMILYEVGIVAGRFFRRKDKKAPAEDAGEADSAP